MAANILFDWNTRQSAMTNLFLFPPKRRGVRFLLFRRTSGNPGANICVVLPSVFPFSQRSWKWMATPNHTHVHSTAMLGAYICQILQTQPLNWFYLFFSHPLFSYVRLFHGWILLNSQYVRLPRTHTPVYLCPHLLLVQDINLSYAHVYI